MIGPKSQLDARVEYSVLPASPPDLVDFVLAGTCCRQHDGCEYGLLARLQPADGLRRLRYQWSVDPH